MLAAGQNIYLQASADNSLRGLIVQVDGGTGAANQLANAGIVNESSGSISAPRGNVTLTGLMINQDGRISATTSVSANGSVILEAAATAQLPVREEAFSLTDALAAREAFISSATGVIPVTKIDGQRLGDGKPGPLTRRVQELYEAESGRRAKGLSA